MLQSSVQVRQATPADWPHLLLVLGEACLYHVTSGGGAEPEDIQTYLTHGTAFLACRSGQPVGALQFQASRGYAWLSLLAVGGGNWEFTVQRLLTHAEEPARRAGAEAWAFVGRPGPLTELLRASGFGTVEEVIELALEALPVSVPGNARVCVRPAKEEDLPALLALDEACFAPLWQEDASALRAYRDRGTLFLVVEPLVEVKGELLGYLVAQPMPEEGLYIVRLAVTPTARGQGIGARLLQEVVEYARAHQASPILLNTQRSNRAARRLYHRFGFQPTGQHLWVLTRRFSSRSA